ncbi:hypothetical protein OKA04_01935 [Luteolibacter flavescens]|uniref:Uncharacterized protein n=1 Tax=Luteolibacter flavescens TaxID=1859460 RepID=A0ABT3FIS9_9BACT|nr:hypothetical protein [Luteolibacter flavescens]MCW1883470.1 hypothetical protein [Luteolibacter flavescens]
MLIWKGLGILIVPLLGLSLIAGLVIGGFAFDNPAAGLAPGLIIAALLNWVLWKVASPKPLPAGGPPPLRPPRRDSLFFIPARVWTWIFVILVLPAFLFVRSAENHEKELAKIPGYTAFKEADKMIASAGDGPTAHGNTPKATETAAGFARAFKAMREVAFTEGSKSPLLTKGEFLTYCHHGRDTVVILCHVPDFRKYADDTRGSLEDIAWTLARHQAAGLADGGNPRLIVGLRGATTYGDLLHGSAKDEEPARANYYDQKTILYTPFADATSGPAPVTQSAPSP